MSKKQPGTDRRTSPSDAQVRAAQQIDADSASQARRAAKLPPVSSSGDPYPGEDQDRKGTR
jgi:hypothetical protein